MREEYQALDQGITAFFISGDKIYELSTMCRMILLEPPETLRDGGVGESTFYTFIILSCLINQEWLFTYAQYNHSYQ